MKKITLTNKKIMYEDDIEEIREGTVRRIGNGGMVLSSKKHVGKKVYLLIKKE